jgi:hypothetical protein
MKNIDFNSIQAKYNITSYIIEFLDEYITKDDALNPEIIPTLFHEYFHHYIFFNSLFYLEGSQRLYDLSSQIFTEKKIKEYIPLKENLKYLKNKDKISRAIVEYEFWSRRSGKKYEPREILAYKNVTKVSFIESDGHYFTNSSNFQISHCQVANENHSTNFEFGAYTINESVAYLLEVFIHSIIQENEEDSEADFLPYKLLSTYILEKRFNIHLVILLCDLSLQSPDPGKYLIQLFKKYEYDLVQHGIKTVDINLFTRMKQIYFEEFSIDPILGYFSKLKNQFYGTFKNAIGNNPYYGWIYNLHNEFFNRISKQYLPDYFIPMIEVEKVKEDPLNAFITFPMPVIIDKGTSESGTYVSFKYDENLFPERKDNIKYNLFFRAFWTIFDQIYYKNLEFQCPIYNYCNNEFKNEECKTKPWKKGILKETCEFGLAANLFKLNETVV